MSIEDFMDDMARQPAPPSRLTADEVYDAGVRQHRRSRRWHGVLIAGTMMAAVGVATFATHTLQVGPFAPSSNDASVTVSPSPALPRLPSAKPTLSLPSPTKQLPPVGLSCDKIKARVLAALQESDVRGKALTSCTADRVVVKVALMTPGQVQVRVVVEVSKSDTSKVSICARTSKCDDTPLGPLGIRTDGSVVLGARSTLIKVHAEVDSPDWSGQIKFVITAEQMKALCLKLGGQL